MGPTTIVAMFAAWLAAEPPGANVVSGAQSGPPQSVPLRSAHLGARVERANVFIDGVVVRGAFETRRVDAQGAATVVAEARPTTAPQFTPEQRAIEADALPPLVGAYVGRSVDGFESAPHLVYLMVVGQPVLAWEVQLPLTTRPEPSRRTLWLSAMTGRVLDDVEQVRSAQARVFLENPAVTPDPVTVTLTGIETNGPGEVLAGQRVVSLNCLSDEPDEVVPYYEEGNCYPAHRLVSDDNGDFFVDLPDVIDVQDSLRPSDEYAELSMYFHAERFLTRMEELGVEGFRCSTSTMLANFRQLEPENDLSFTPLNNAFYTNQCDPTKGATMLFGQGSEVDFGYDGDVIYHELGHGMVAMLTPSGLAGRSLKPEASSPDGGAINEAVADYFAFLMTDDPDLAEYVGRFWASSGRAQIRSANNQKVCPDNTTGQVHNDGEPVGAALWAARYRIGPVFDEVVLETLTRVDKDSTFGDFSGVITQVATEYASRGDIGEDGVEVLRRSLAARGLDDCPRIITDQKDVADGRSMYLRRATPGVQPFWPGPMQLRYEVPEGETSAEIVMSMRSRKDDPPQGHVLVKFADEPITFEYSVVALDDAGDSTGNASSVREVTFVRGDWDLEIEPDRLGDGSYRVQLQSLRPGQVLHVSLGSSTPSDVQASGVAVRSPNFDAEGEGDTDGDTDGGPASDDGVDVVNGQDAVAGGCGCRYGGDAPIWQHLTGLWLLTWIRRRR